MTMSDVTRLLAAMQHGDAKAAEELLNLVYAELRQLARNKMAHEHAGHTLQPTALVHEAWLRMGEQQFNNRAHFFASAAEAMRRILVESARRKKRSKHGGNLVRVDIDGVDLPLPLPPEELLALDEALNRLVKIDRRAAEMVMLCFFAGLTQRQAAAELGVSWTTGERLWAYARAWLFREVKLMLRGER
jgi:RNA polymerase sigma factor (TIGR02999 family)